MESASSDNSGEKIYLKLNTLASLIKEEPDVIVLEDMMRTDFYYKTQTQTQEYLQQK